MSPFSKATCLSNIRSHSASRLRLWGGGGDKRGIEGALKAYRRKRLERCLAPCQEKEVNKSEKGVREREGGMGEKERVGAGERE